MSKNLPALVISGITISQDAEGRFSLNDLHKAAGGEIKDDPANFLRLDATKGLIDAISNSAEMQNKNPVSIRPGRYGGSSVVKELVYRYAMWISPTFELKVIRAYDALATTASSHGLSVADVIDLIQKVVPTIITSSFFALKEHMAEDQRKFEQRFEERLAAGQIGTAAGVTTGVLLDDFGIKGVSGLSVRMSNILCKRGCQLPGGERAHSGKRTAKLFQPDKARQIMKDWLANDCRQYIQRRKGQGNLFPLKRAR